MIISVANFSGIADEEVQAAIRAINRQIVEDYEPYWSMGARLRLEGKAGRQPTPQSPAEMRGDAIIYLWDKADVPDALGYPRRTIEESRSVSSSPSCRRRSARRGA